MRGWTDCGGDILVLVKDCPQCTGCPLRDRLPNRNLVPFRPGSGDRLVIAEAAGSEEETQGTPLVGPSGRVFDSWLRKAGINRDTLTLANVLSCRPPDNKFPGDADSGFNENEAAQIVRHCVKNHLLPLLESRKWSRVDIIGGKSLEALTGRTSIMNARGSMVEVDTEEIKSRLKI